MRTDSGEIGHIFQINDENRYSKYRTKIDTNSTCKSTYLRKEDIVKHSKNIIDLIEEGDYVNGVKIEQILQVSHKHNSIIINNEEELLEQDIKSIVTHQQFKQVEYGV